MSTQGMNQLRWSTEKRLEFIEYRLFWEGHINRGDLIAYFGISVPQASLDFREYNRRAPQNMIYDPKNKFYVPGPNFKPILFHPSSDSYFADLVQSVRSGRASAGSAPEFATLPTPERSVDPQILRLIHQAIQGGRAIEIQYQSMKRPDPIWRWITPHAFGFDGFRWHVRAFCHLDHAFKDFVLARVIQTGQTKRHPIDPRDDLEWNRNMAVKIAPHPKLSEGQKRIIERDYGMENGMLTILVREALLFYLKRRLGLDRTLEDGPESQQIVLLSIEPVVEDVLETAVEAPPQRLASGR